LFLLEDHQEVKLYRNQFQVFCMWLSSSNTSWTMSKKCWERFVPAGGSSGGQTFTETGSKSSLRGSALHTHPELWVGNVRKALFLLEDHDTAVPLHLGVQLLKELVPSLLHTAQLFIHILNYE
jgi:hypothetical protein